MGAALDHARPPRGAPAAATVAGGMIQGMADVTPPDQPDSAEPGITFASELDATRYRVLAARLRELQAQIEAMEHDIAAILRRAHWSLDAILEREG